MNDTQQTTGLPEITVVPANEATWDEIQAVFGTRGDPGTCYCQWPKLRDKEFTYTPSEELPARLREQTQCDNKGTKSTSGLIAYINNEPVGWCAVEPRTAYARLLRTRVPWTGREEDKTDDEVWTVMCFVVRTGFRKLGVSRALAKAAVPFARERGARALEGYPMLTSPGKEITWGELFVGSRSIFVDAGFIEVSHPTLRRVVMRIDFHAGTK